jgi:hypothetical protein
MVRSSSSGRAHPLAVACLVASSIAWSTQLRAQAAPAGAGAPPGVGVGAAAAEVPPVASPPTEALEPGLEEPSVGELPPPSAPSAGAGSERGELDLRLRQLEDERTSTVLPWVVFSGGTAIVVLSSALVTAETLSCDSDSGCETANWAAVAVVAGTAVMTAGAIWLVRVGADNTEVDLKQRSVQEDLQRLEARQQRARAPDSAPRVSMRWQF